MKKGYFVYFLRCSDNSLYCGIAKDISTRLIEHNETKRGAKYTRSRRPVKLVYYRYYQSKQKALRAEIAHKQLSKKEKEERVKNFKHRKSVV